MKIVKTSLGMAWQCDECDWFDSDIEMFYEKDDKMVCGIHMPDIEG
jgi:hypothetical protein